MLIAVCDPHKTVRFRLALLALLSSACTSTGLAQAASPPTAPHSYQTEAVVVEQAETIYKYNADGTGERSMHLRIKVQNDAGARQLGVLTFPYASGNETAQVQTLVVNHSDGTSAETPASDAIDMPAPVTQQAPLYSDLKILQIPVRGLRVGDTLDFRVVSQRKNAEAPSQFWGSFSFTKPLVVLAESLTLDLPAGKYVQVWSPDFKPVQTDADGRRVYRWTGSQLTATSSEQKKDEADQAKKDTKPDVAWTTFHSWSEVAEWYRSLAAPAVVPTDALRARADEITSQAKSPQEQIQALYSFVSSRIRYVGVDFGIGRYRPHAAAEVLANQYGDCKDKDSLLEALLRAKGFASAPALIGANLDMVAGLPSPIFFNHVITTVALPSGRLWMDSTPGVAPFQFLLAPLRDKDSLVIPPAGDAALERTPAKPPFPFVDRFEATATLKKDGELTAKVNIDFRSDNEIAVRSIAQALAPAQWDQGTQYLVNVLGFSGQTSNSAFSRSDDTSTPMHVSYDYTRKPFGDWDNFRIIPLFPVNTMPAAPDKQPAHDIDIGPARTETVTSRIQLPEGFSADLPDAVHVHTPFAAFDKTYKFENGELIAERTIVVLQAKLPPSSWEEYKKFAKNISLGNESWIQITAPTSAGQGPHPPLPGVNNPEAAGLIREATVLEQSRDWDGALRKLDQAKALQPNQPFLWSNYGYVATLRGHFDEAKGYFRQELEHHPDEVFVVRFFAGFLFSQREDKEALKVLNAYFQTDASDPDVDRMLALAQAKSNMAGAIATLQRASQAAPDNEMIHFMLGECLVRNHQNAEAAVIAKKLLDNAADNGLTLNDASYLLAEADGDLSLAEKDSRKAIDALESQTAAADVSEANAESFRRTSSLIAYWDTLGYILLKEHKLDDARDYLEAAWRNMPDPEVASHYGQVLEALGHPSDALDVYKMSLPGSNPTPYELPELQPLDASIKRLASSGITPKLKAGPQRSLQDERFFKFKVKQPGKSYSSSIFRLQLASGKIQGLLRISDQPASADVENSIRNLALPHLVPAHSSGRILRDAVLTCSSGQSECFFVLMPVGAISAEQTLR